MKNSMIWFLVLIICVSFCACGDNKSPSETPDSSSLSIIETREQSATAPSSSVTELPVTSSTTIPSTEHLQQEELIETPYAVIVAPAAFDGKVLHEVTSEAPYTLKFYNAEDGTEIFSLVFNGTDDALTLLGTLIGETENTVIYMNVPALDQESPHFRENASYQEEMSTLIARLSADYEFVQNQIIPFVYRETMVIQTDVLNLHYPVKWKELVSADVSADGVRFHAGDTALFDVLFGDHAEGYRIGNYKGTDISILLHDVDKSACTEEEYSQYMEMQEDSNILLDWLEKDEEFVHR